MSEPTPEHDPEITEPTDPPVQPTEAVEPSEGKVIEFRTPRGSLTLRPNQTELDPIQRASLVAIGIDVVGDPQVIPHWRAFMHMCQANGLDPWAREAYLIGRGKGDKRTYTKQTGIDGYRKMSARTGRFIRVADTLWTGADDDDQSYYRDERGVMRRVWYDQWPASRGFPGAAKVIIEHYDEANNVVRTEAVADWAMYAPFSDKWEGYGQSRKKVIGADGKPEQTLNDMWAKGYAHMLAKCAEALAHRKAFPAASGGFLTHEEMHQADQQERSRVEAEQTRARQGAYAAATAGVSAPILATVVAPEDPEAPAGPIPVGDVAAEVIETIQNESPTPQDEADDEPAEETKVEWLLTELQFQADVFGVTTTRLAARPVAALRKNVEDFTLSELHAMVSGLRPATVEKMRGSYPEPEVAAYAAVTPEAVVDVLDMFVTDGDVEHQPHAYIDNDGVCATCGEIAPFGDDPLHPR